MKKNLKEVEDLLRNGKLPDKDLARIRHQVWQKILKAQRERHQQPKMLLNLQPWIWFLASIILIILCLVLMFLLK